LRKQGKIETCFCGSGFGFSDCCGKFINGTGVALTPEQLMRSRYGAYCVEDEAYLLNTWHPSTRPSSLELGNQRIKWLSLEIINASEIRDETATVEFVARFKQNGRAGKLHEISLFRRERGLWFYLEANVPV